jgi:hypothetical protein
MPLRRLAASALILAFLPGLATARTLDQVPSYFKEEGGFVSYPAVAVGALGGVAGAIIALPASLVAAPLGFAAGDTLGYAMVPVSVLARGGTEVGYHLGGGIPWALKNGFYDAPMAGVAKIKGEPASGVVAVVEPPPQTPALPQYLDSTPKMARLPVEPPSGVALAPPASEYDPGLIRQQVRPPNPNTPFVLPSSVYERAERNRRAAEAANVNILDRGAVRPPVVRPAAPAAPAPAAAVPSEVVVPAAAALAPAQPAVATPERAMPAPAAAPAQPAPVASAPKPAPQAEVEAPAAAEAPADEGDRPSLKKKKKSFSERFRF